MCKLCSAFSTWKKKRKKKRKKKKKIFFASPDAAGHVHCGTWRSLVTLWPVLLDSSTEPLTSHQSGHWEDPNGTQHQDSYTDEGADRGSLWTSQATWLHRPLLCCLTDCDRCMVPSLMSRPSEGEDPCPSVSPLGDDVCCFCVSVKRALKS